MKLRLEGKKALITGGGSGMGQAAAIRFAEEGADVFIVDINPEGMQNTAAQVEKLGRRVFTHQADVRDEQQVVKMVERAVKELGNVDILLSAVGGEPIPPGQVADPRLRPIVETTLEHWRAKVALSLESMFLVDREVARAMIKADKGCGIINIASGGMLIAVPGRGAYDSDKAGVWTLTRVLGKELGCYGINCNTIAQGLTNTPMVREWVELIKRDPQAVHWNVVLKPHGEPIDIANSDEASCFTVRFCVLTAASQCTE